MGFERRAPLDPGRSRHVPEFTDDEVSEVCAALMAEAPELWAVLKRNADQPGAVSSADYDDAYDRMLTWLFERRYIDTHIEMAMLFKAVTARVAQG